MGNKEDGNTVAARERPQCGRHACKGKGSMCPVNLSFLYQSMSQVDTRGNCIV